LGGGVSKKQEGGFGFKIWEPEANGEVHSLNQIKQSKRTRHRKLKEKRNLKGKKCGRRKKLGPSETRTGCGRRHGSLREAGILGGGGESPKAGPEGRWAARNVGGNRKNYTGAF